MSSHDVFNRGAAYEGYIGRWSRRMAPEFVDWIGAEPGGRWLDVGCGTGALTDAILANAGPATVVGIDPSSGLVEHARESIRDPRASFSVGNAMQLDFEAGVFDVAAAALVLNFTPEPSRALSEMRRVARTVAAYVWDYAGEMRLLRYFFDAAADVDPAARELDEGVRFKFCNPAGLQELFASAGLASVEVRPLDCLMKFSGFDDFWNPFLGGQGPAPAYVMSLDESKRNRLRDLLRSRLPVEADGSIQMVSRAWAVKGHGRPT